jgi:hypothetical protein
VKVRILLSFQDVSTYFDPENPDENVRLFPIPIRSYESESEWQLGHAVIEIETVPPEDVSDGWLRVAARPKTIRFHLISGLTSISPLEIEITWSDKGCLEVISARLLPSGFLD